MRGSLSSSSLLGLLDYVGLSLIKITVTIRTAVATSAIIKHIERQWLLEVAGSVTSVGTKYRVGRKQPIPTPTTCAYEPIEVDAILSLFGNQLAEILGGEFWIKGCPEDIITCPIIAKMKLSFIKHRSHIPTTVRKIPKLNPALRPHFSRICTAGKFTGIKMIIELIGKKFIAKLLTP
jgi:hypothetical protein